MVFDTSKMTADQAAAMEVAEAAREKWREPSLLQSCLWVNLTPSDVEHRRSRS